MLPCMSLIHLSLSLSCHPGLFPSCHQPQKAFFELAIQNMGINLAADQKQESSKESTGIVMIGDDVEQDLGGGAAELGLIRYLVQTGKYRAKDEDRDAHGGLDGTFADFGAMIDYILSNQQQ